MMESWFHADKDALAKFYGSGLKSGLKNATRKTDAGDYFDHKTSHGPKLLEAIDPVLVRTAAPNCDKMFKTILDFLAS